MATLLHKESICGWCGKDAAPLECICKQVCFCDTTCQKKSWKEGHHKLMCTEGKEKNNSSSYSTGDIVNIHGLQSEQGKRMNDHLAEIISFNEVKKRYEVIFTTENCVVKTASMKYENLAMHLSVLEGAKGCTRTTLSDISTPKRQEKLINECKKVAKNFSSNETGKNIMNRLKKNDNNLLQAMAMTGGITLTSKQTEQMLKNGFLDWLFTHFEYPAVIDESNKPPLSIDNMLCVATTVLNRYQLGVAKEQDLNHYRVQACKKIAPLIMAAATKKRRVFKHVEYWVPMQFSFVSLLQNCLLADKFASTVLLNQLDPFVTKTLLQHCVDLFSSTPKLHLKKKSGMIRNTMGSNTALELQERSMKMVLMPVLLELMDYDNVGERWVTYIGKLSIPPGIKNYSHKSFASVIFHLFAQAAVDEINTATARRGGQPLVEEVLYIYGCMNKCEALREIMGPFNYDLAKVQKPSQLLQWAHKTLGSSKLYEKNANEDGWEGPNTQTQTEISPLMMVLGVVVIVAGWWYTKS